MLCDFDLLVLLNDYGFKCRLTCNQCNAWDLLNVINIILNLNYHLSFH